MIWKELLNQKVRCLIQWWTLYLQTKRWFSVFVMYAMLIANKNKQWWTAFTKSVKDTEILFSRYFHFPLGHFLTENWRMRENYIFRSKPEFFNKSIAHNFFTPLPFCWRFFHHAKLQNPKWILLKRLEKYFIGQTGISVLLIPIPLFLWSGHGYL